ncbi:Cof-type HAD-IIB family hydrolase [Photobacterium indicum]|uniref:Cof-type HAD-IIB family hydrolase n=2 Tax=Photobacterium indicum TaxID=81447 RepID=A0A2T3LDK1_9GAMM|nr:Cof-type HAD-IIB family hydrolase [Photobacterium indicum]
MVYAIHSKGINMTYSVLALDLDGTTLTTDHQILPEIKDAIAHIKDTTTVLLVTGRHHTAARPYHHDLELDTPIICCNGTYVYDYSTNSVITEQAISHDNARQFVTLAQQNKLNMVMYVTDKMTFSAKTPIHYMEAMETWSQQFPADIKPEIERIDSFLDEIDNNTYIWKFVVEGNIENITNFAELPFIRSTFTGEKSWSNRIDFSNKGNTKGFRLAEYLADQRIDPSKVVAIGDNHNDISMITLAGLGVAMANADEAVKQIADRITTTTNNDQGISEIIADCF